MHDARYAGIFLLLIALTGLIACDEKASGAEAAPLPNILFILTDDQGWGDLSWSGNTNIHTPHIDALAENGAALENFFVSPVCSPTRAEFLTGRYHPRGGVYSTSAGGERLDLDETTIADIFQRAGYRTAAFGKWHNGMQYPYHPNGRGFEEYYGFASGHWGHYFSPMLEHNGEIVTGNGYLPDDLTNRVMQFMEEHRNEPFFVYMAYNTPHSPMQVPDRWWNTFKGQEFDMRHRDPEKEDIPFTRAALAMCENIDWNVGRLTEKLRELGLEDNTIVVFLSDNGPNSWRWNGGLKGRKGAVDEGGVKSPTFIQWKGQIKAGKRIPQIAAAIDFLPTLAELAGIPCETNKPLDGKSLRPLLLEEYPAWEDRLIYNYFRNRLSVRSQRFRLDNEDQLFDMNNDPGQSRNVADEFPEITTELKRAKTEYQNEVIAELPEQDDRPFPIGHPDYVNTQIPARDGLAHGDIQRSNRWPNCSFFTNWTSLNDSVTWDVEVLAEGDFEVVVYYTCPEESVGATFALTFHDAEIEGQIIEAHDPPLVGMEEDRVERGESYVKDFKPLRIGTVHLPAGRGALTLKARDIPGEEVMDFRLLMLKRKT